jgi:S-methylmethionine-dependent homocysteine/selenocysteine methylase
MTTLDELVAETGWVIADGATGTNYFKLGLETGYPPELWNIERPDDVAGLHSAFIKAGSQLVLTNSFGGTHHRLRLHGAQDRVTELNLAAARIARKAADAAGAPVMVAGSIGPTGELFAPMGALDYADARAAFTEQALALAEGGADLLWVETMSSLEEVSAAIDAAKRTGLPVAACMTFDTAARSMMGVMPADFAGKAAEYGADLVGANRWRYSLSRHARVDGRLCLLRAGCRYHGHRRMLWHHAGPHRCDGGGAAIDTKAALLSRGRRSCSRQTVEGRACRAGRHSSPPQTRPPSPSRLRLSSSPPAGGDKPVA